MRGLAQPPSQGPLLPAPWSERDRDPDSGRHVTSVYQGLCLSRSMGRVGENPGNEVGAGDERSTLTFCDTNNTYVKKLVP